MNGNGTKIDVDTWVELMLDDDVISPSIEMFTTFWFWLIIVLFVPSVGCTTRGKYVPKSLSATGLVVSMTSVDELLN